MDLQILTNQVEQDRLNPSKDDSERLDVVQWKRIVAKGIATENQAQTKFTVLLDLRSRLLRVLTKEEAPGCNAADIAQALMYEMASYTMEPSSRLGAPNANDVSKAEWIVRDADHVSGLLHRLGEAKRFPARTEPPHPPGYDDVRSVLLDATDENLLAMFAWDKRRQNPGRLNWRPPFNTHDWDVLRDRYLPLEDDLQLFRQFARFFGQVAQYAQAVAVIEANPTDRPDYSAPTNAAARKAAEEFIGQLHHELIQVGLKLLAACGRTFTLPPHLRS